MGYNTVLNRELIKCSQVFIFLRFRHILIEPVCLCWVYFKCRPCDDVYKFLWWLKVQVHLHLHLHLRWWIVCRSRNAHDLTQCLHKCSWMAPNRSVLFFIKLKQASKLASMGKLKPLTDQVIDWSWSDLICAKMRDMILEFFHKLECTSEFYRRWVCVIWSVLMRHKTSSESSSNYFGDVSGLPSFPTPSLTENTLKLVNSSSRSLA